MDPDMSHEKKTLDTFHEYGIKTQYNMYIHTYVRNEYNVIISYKVQMVFQLTETWPKPGSYWQYIAFHESIFCTIRGSLNKGMSYPLSHAKAHECIWRELCPKTNSISEFIAILQLSAGDIIYNMVQLCKTMYNSGFRECPPKKSQIGS